MSDIIHVIRLIKQSSNGYVQLCQLKQKYREKYGRDLCQRPLKKWLDKIPDVYIDHHPVNDSIHVHETHEAHEGNDEQIPKNQNNNNINNKKRQKKKKTANASARSRLQENTQTCISPLLLPSSGCSPQRQKTTLTCLGTTRGAAIAASAATKTTEQEKEKEQEGFESNEPPASLHLSQAREVNGKKAPESKKKKAKKTKNLAMIMEEQKPQKKKIGEKKKATKKKNKGGDGVNDLCFAFARTKAKAKMKKAVVPIRNDCYYGMANHTANSKEGDSKGRRCIMHFGFTSSGKTCWSKNTFKTKGQALYKSKNSFSRAIVSGYMANKIKNSCGHNRRSIFSPDRGRN